MSLPDKPRWIYALGGFGIASITKEHVRKNIKTLIQIAKQAARAKKQ